MTRLLFQKIQSGIHMDNYLKAKVFSNDSRFLVSAMEGIIESFTNLFDRLITLFINTRNEKNVRIYFLSQRRE